MQKALRRAGWSSQAVPAACAQQNGRSAGLAVLVRLSLQVHPVVLQIAAASIGRFAADIVRLKGISITTAVAHLVAGLDPGGLKMEILSGIGHLLMEWHQPFALAADTNTLMVELEPAGFLTRSKAIALALPPGAKTCVHGAGLTDRLSCGVDLLAQSHTERWLHDRKALASAAACLECGSRF